MSRGHLLQVPALTEQRLAAWVSQTEIDRSQYIQKGPGGYTQVRKGPGSAALGQREKATVGLWARRWSKGVLDILAVAASGYVA